AGKERQVQLVSKPRKLLIYILFAPQVMPLQLDIEPFFEHIVEPRQVALPLAPADAPMHKAVVSACQADQPARISLDIRPCREMLAFFMPEFYRRDQLREILIPAQIDRQQRQKAAVIHRDLGPDHRLYPGIARLM